MSSDKSTTLPADDADKSGWSAAMYNHAASFVYSQKFTSSVLDLLAAKSGERIFDFGCGFGELTSELETLIEKAKENGLKHVFVGDIQALDIPQDLENVRFDAVFSNAALHWCKQNLRGVLDSVKRVLRPGGRFACEMGGHMNCIGEYGALHHVLRTRGYDPITRDPWYFPSVEEYNKLLVSAGFEVKQITLTPRVTPLVAGLSGWLRTFVRHSFLRDIPDEEADAILAEAEDICRIDCQDGHGAWQMMYVRLRFLAVCSVPLTHG
ncbi:cyclopropane-fatty-acyl-phospholipid synthase [Fistulina hepatica ATCC 64428]|uniref:Cyclopropane-fatty-acyl-phospholipid synthase n=1 Tax=Fistulina hepatica ATCC 64428 TaxID=1128425 RepID=A0A0D6ZZD3_9AGAR|nr:cyclopropane-fatty-acyl-phospholipid synthase [Fistulina hepatica ATCC 64428]